MKSIKEKAWYPYAVAACIAVVLFVFLSNFQTIWGAVKTFFGFFRIVILGCIIAFIVNPLSKLLARTVFKKVKKDKGRLAMSNLVAFIIVILFIVFSLVIVIPQLIDSVQKFLENLPVYRDTIMGWLDNAGITLESLGLGSDEAEEVAKLEASSLLGNIGQYAGTIMSTTMNVGKVVFNFAVAFMMSMYILGAKESLKKGCGRLLKAIVGESRYGGVCTFLQKSNAVFNSYIVYNLIDSLIIGTLNAIFMLILGMDYMGLISFIVAIFNLIPTFGPLIGGAIGAFILLLVRPLHALIFLGFTVILQLFDGYVLKPKLFGDSLGVSGLWILVGVIVGGKMFGVVGILLSIPVVALIDFLYSNYLLPALERKRGIKQLQDN
ncbi:MAG: AI-2E family transporter [Spirochaetales bacterium]|nr:AI-2E family transporter [Spirochaetales bacterium]